MGNLICNGVGVLEICITTKIHYKSKLKWVDKTQYIYIYIYIFGSEQLYEFENE